MKIGELKISLEEYNRLKSLDTGALGLKARIEEQLSELEDQIIEVECLNQWDYERQINIKIYPAHKIIDNLQDEINEVRKLNQTLIHESNVLLAKKPKKWYQFRDTLPNK